MGVISSLEKRRSIYGIGNKLPVGEDKVIELVQKATELVPDAFNMKSSRVVLALGQKHVELWDKINDYFQGKPKEKIDSFKKGAGTIYFFIDNDTVKSLQGKHATYAQHFPVWANQASGMLQISIWTALRDLDIGASLQHYIPPTTLIHDYFGISKEYQTVAMMPFGNIEAEREPKEKEDISKRVVIAK